MISIRIIFLLASLLGSIHTECLKTNCDCFDYYGPTHYQCPAGRSMKIAINDEENATKVICYEKDSPDRFLPRNVFLPRDLTVESCRISEETAKILNFRNIEVLDVNDCILEENFLQILFGSELPRLKRITFQAIHIDHPNLQDINAPNLNYVGFHKMNTISTSKIIQQLTSIEVLNFVNNKMISMESNVFEHLSNLVELHLMFNSIEEVKPDAFRGLKNLKLLNLASNRIKYISREVLRPLNSLHHAILESNDGIILDDFLLANFSQLSIVRLGRSGMSSVPEKLFSGSKNLSEIYLNDNNLLNVPKRLFEGLINLKFIDLNNNKIKTLNDGLFENLVNLQTLDLNENEISSIRPHVFSGLKKLMDLRLNHNNITTIHKDAFKSNSGLQTLHLSHNKYGYEVVTGKFYPPSPFSKCENLIYLDLSYNLMKDVPEDLFIHAKSLEYLNLEGNKKESLDFDELKSWGRHSRDIRINLMNNNISYFQIDEFTPKFVDPDYEELFPFVDEKEDARQFPILLNISRNPLSCDCYAENFASFVRKNRAIFSDLDELTCSQPSKLRGMRFLNVSRSEFTCDLQSVTDAASCTSSGACSCLWRPFDKTVIVNCSSRMMTSAPGLKMPTDLMYEKTEVHLEDNMLTDFSQLEGYENVTSLILTRNNIHQVSWIPANVQTIDISYNNLTELSETVLKELSLHSVINVTMGNNPWSCDCYNYPTRNFVVENIKKVDAENIKCDSTQLTIHSLLEEDFCYKTTNVLVIFVTFIMLPTLILALIYYKYEQEIKVWLYARNMCLSFLVEEDIDKCKEYDVFVSYSHKDEDFVENQLVPVLEDCPPYYKLCLHKRDWIPGSFIAENIANSVAKSRRTLIVLTPNFLESFWGVMEFRTAHAEAMKEKRNRVILLLKEDIDVDKLDEELKLYISTNTYIKWGDPWFWKKLRYALPHSEINECHEIEVKK